MKVYVVTSGSYSDYHIDAVFTDHNKARRYANLDTDRNIEEYEADYVNTVYRDNVEYNIYYNFSTDEIVSLCLLTANPKDDGWLYPTSTEFQTRVSTSAKLNADVLEHGKESTLLKKIVQDKFAAYLYKHGLQREELIRKIEEEIGIRKSIYQMYSTSLDTGPSPEQIASRTTTAIVQKIMADGGIAPPYEEVVTIYEMERKKAEDASQDKV